MLVKTRINSRKLFAITSCILAGFFSVSSFAFTLGDIRLQSALNQALDAEIQLLELDGLDESQILVSLGSEADFQRVGVDPLPLLNELEFEVEVLSGELGLIHISSEDAIVEPYLNFVLNVRWPSGRVIREYTVLLDLPTFSANPAPAPAPAETAPAPVPRPQTATTPTPTPVPTPAPELAQEPEPEPEPEPVPEPERQIPEPASSNPASSNTASETVVIQAGDSMWNIALATRPDNSVSVQQMMVAIQRANTGSDAFINNNINGIRAGRVLRIPDRQEIAAISQQQALNQVAQQNQQFSGGQPLAVNTSQGADNNTRDELSIITDSEPDDSQEVSGLNDTIRALENELAISEENLDAARLENQELSSRLEDLEEQIGILENIIAIEDQRMAELQAQLAEQQNNPQPADTEVLAVNDTAPQPAPQPTAPAPETAPQPAPDNPAIVTPRLSNFLSSTVGMGLALLVLLALVVGFLVARNRSATQDEDEFDPGFEDENEFDSTENSEDLNNEDSDSESEALQSPAFTDIDDLHDSSESDTDEEQDSDDDGRFFNDDPDDGYDESDSSDTEDSDAVLDEDGYDSQDEDDDYQDEDIVDEPQAKTGFLAGLLARFSRKKPVEDDYDQEYEDVDEEDDEDLEETESEAGLESEETLADTGAADLDSWSDAEEDEGDEQLSDETSEEDSFEVDELLANSPDDSEEEPEDLLDLDADETAEETEDTDSTEEELPESAELQEAEDDELEIDFEGLDEDGEDAVADDALEGTEDTTGTAIADAADETEEVFEFNLDDSSGDSAENSTESPEGAEAQEPEVNDLESFEFSVDDDTPSTVTGTESDTDAEEQAEDDLETFDFGNLSLDEQTKSNTESNTENASAEAESDDLEEIEFIDEPDSDDDDTGQVKEKAGGSLGKLGVGDALMDDDSDEEELEMITDQDEVSTKLDLAVAYQAMEDLDGAREILQEVIAEGNEEQVAEAKRLLEEWGDS